MTEPAEITAKKAHGQAIIDKLAELKALAMSQPDLYWPGNPPALVQIVNVCNHNTMQMRADYGLPAPE